MITCAPLTVPGAAAVLSAECPSCASPVHFRHAASAATVCPSCHSTVLREGADELVIWGKVSAFSRQLSPVQVGATGRVGNRGFMVAGVLRKGRPGVKWNEWFLVFDDGGTGWLGEGNSMFQLFGGQAAGRSVPPPEELTPGETIERAGRRWVVVESAKAEVLAAEGELPFAVRGGEARAYADLRSVDGKNTATIDGADEPPVMWEGRVVPLTSLNMEGLRPITGWSDPSLSAFEGPDIEVKRSLECPNCAGSLTLRSPGTTVRLACEYCGSDLDVHELGDQSTASVLRAHEGRVWKPRLPLGSKGKLDGVEWEIIGAMKRAVRAGGVEYPWVEYFLYNPYRGSRFLVEDQRGHWNLVSRAPDVPAASGRTRYGKRAYRGKKFRHFQGGKAYVKHVLGEFDWQVSVGDEVKTDDYVAPPLMLSREGDKHEMVWSVGRYTSHDDVEKAFKVRTRTPWGVAPNQPNPYVGGLMWTVGLGGAAALFAAALLTLVIGVGIADNTTLLSQSFTSSGRPSDVFLSDSFSLSNSARRDLEVKTTTGLSRSKGQVHVALLNLDTGKSYFPINTASSNSRTGRVSSPDPGRYVARVEVARPATTSSREAVAIKVVKDPPTVGWMVPALLYPMGIPVLLFMVRAWFESRRWAESDHAG